MLCSEAVLVALRRIQCVEACPKWSDCEEGGYVTHCNRPLCCVTCSCRRSDPCFLILTPARDGRVWNRMLNGICAMSLSTNLPRLGYIWKYRVRIEEPVSSRPMLSGDKLCWLVGQQLRWQSFAFRWNLGEDHKQGRTNNKVHPPVFSSVVCLFGSGIGKSIEEENCVEYCFYHFNKSVTLEESPLTVNAIWGCIWYWVFNITWLQPSFIRRVCKITQWNGLETRW